MWLIDGREVRDHFRRGFISLYTSSLTEAKRVLNQNSQWQVRLSDEIKSSLDDMVMLEVR